MVLFNCIVKYYYFIQFCYIAVVLLLISLFTLVGGELRGKEELSFLLLVSVQCSCDGVVCYGLQCDRHSHWYVSAWDMHLVIVMCMLCDSHVHIRGNC